MSEFKIMVFGEIPQGFERSSSEETKEILFFQRIWKESVFCPGCSLRPVLFLPVECAHGGMYMCENGDQFLMQSHMLVRVVRMVNGRACTLPRVSLVGALGRTVLSPPDSFLGGKWYSPPPYRKRNWDKWGCLTRWGYTSHLPVHWAQESESVHRHFMDLCISHPGSTECLSWYNVLISWRLD